MFPIYRTILITALFLITGTPNASADKISYKFTGYVDAIIGTGTTLLTDSIKVGDTLSGQINIDDGSSVDQYNQLSIEMFFSVNTWDLLNTYNEPLNLDDPTQLWGYGMDQQTNSNLPAPTGWFEHQITLYDPLGVENISIGRDLVLSSLTTGTLRLCYNTFYSPNYTILSTFQIMTTPVPEPNTMLLLGVGLLGLIGTRSQKIR